MQQIFVPLLIAVISAIGGGGVWAFLTRWFDRNKETEQSEIVRLRDDIAESKKAHSACEDKVAELERRVETVEHHHASQLPRWIMNASRRIEWVNDAAMMAIFVRLELDREDVIGRTFGELLDAQASTEIGRLERAALADPPNAVSSQVTMLLGQPAMHVVIVACMGRLQELIYEGYAFRAQDPATLDARGEERRLEQHGATKIRLSGRLDEHAQE